MSTLKKVDLSFKNNMVDEMEEAYYYFVLMKVVEVIQERGYSKVVNDIYTACKQAESMRQVQ